MTVRNPLTPAFFAVAGPSLGAELLLSYFSLQNSILTGTGCGKVINKKLYKMSPYVALQSLKCFLCL
jgi:hypothetical protein